MQQNAFVIDKIKEPHVDKNIRVGESVEEINSFLKPFNIYAQKVEMQNGNLFYLLYYLVIKFDNIFLQNNNLVKVK